MPLSAGDKLGPYEILGPLGAGGMGEVYKARDTRLDRIVALKTARAQFTDRFAREARATAALNHPHIATLHDVGPDYFVMEFVEGENLRGPLPVGRALLYAGQILEALEAAHRKGIVHRDLKPANIMVTKSGVKLLDFGLAQMETPAALDGRTATMALSTEGVIAGTLQYMSPEQLQGKKADARSDIFAFGLVLYEMLTGRRAFDAGNAASLISAVLTAEPPSLGEVLPATHPALVRILNQCLTKDPEDRWQAAADIRRALELVEITPAAGPGAVAPAAPGGLRFRWEWMIAAAALGALLTAAVSRLSPPKPPEPWTFRPLTYSGSAASPSLSPDGKQMAFTWSGEHHNDGLGLYLQLVNGGNPLLLRDARPSGKVAWSPDGSRLAFIGRDGGLYVMPALGGPPQRISVSPPGARAGGISWSANGDFLVFTGTRPGLSVVSAEGGEAHELTRLPAGGDPLGQALEESTAYDSSPSIAPDSRAVAFVRYTSSDNACVMVLLLNRDGTATGSPKQITNGVWLLGNRDRADLEWTADGKAILFAGSAGSGHLSLWRISRGGGEPVRFEAPSVDSDEPTIARQSSRMVYVKRERETKIFKMALGPRGVSEPLPLVETEGDQRDLGVAPDGLHIAFTSNRTGFKEIWIADSDGSNQTQRTFFHGPAVGSPRWSPDGKWIAFDGSASGSFNLYLIPAEGGKPVRLTSDPGNEIRPSWSHDGQWIYFGWTRGGSGAEIWKIRPSGGEPVQVTHHGGSDAFETPDGRWLYVCHEPKLSRMRPDGSEETPLRNDVASNFWVVGRHSVYVFAARRPGEPLDLLRAPFGGQVFETVYRFSDANAPTSGGTALGVPHDEDYLIYRRQTRLRSTLMLIEDFR